MSPGWWGPQRLSLWEAGREVETGGTAASPFASDRFGRPSATSGRVGGRTCHLSIRAGSRSRHRDGWTHPIPDDVGPPFRPDGGPEAGRSAVRSRARGMASHFRKFGEQDARPVWRGQQLGAAPFGSPANEADVAEPRFVVLPGDFLAHNFRREFDTAAADHSDAAYRLFVRKTMQFLALQLEQTFPEAPILPALGNDDLYCGNYQLQPQGPFLADTLPIIRGMVGALVSLGFEQNWISYGNYSVTVRGLRMIFPNTVFFSANYRNTCGSMGDADPGSATLAWLRGRTRRGGTSPATGLAGVPHPSGGRRLRDATQGIVPGHDRSNVEANLCRALLRADAAVFGQLLSRALPAIFTWMISACSATMTDITALC